MRKRLPALAVLAALAVGACAHGERDADAVAIAATAEAFLAEQREGAWSSAFARLHVNLQRDCESAEGLRQAVVSALGPAKHWTIGRPAVRRYTAALAAAAQRRDGVAVPIDIAFDRQGRSWTITGWTSQGSALCR
jgi:hypothetical protein